MIYRTLFFSRCNACKAWYDAIVTCKKKTATAARMQVLFSYIYNHDA